MCEIKSPLLIATACFDKQVRLISLQDKKIVGIFSGHLKGVNQLDYTAYTDGFIISVGYEPYAYIWSLEGGMGSIQSSLNLIRRKNSKKISNLHGKLSKGGQIIKYAKFIEKTTFCATVDEKFTCKIWNFINLEMMQ